MAGEYRHIGGSILPSNSPEVLQLMQLPGGTLQVKVDAEDDTHRLWATRNIFPNDPQEVAQHPNGHSLACLARRMRSEPEERVKAQHEYILLCGGTAQHIDRVLGLMQELRNGTEDPDART